MPVRVTARTSIAIGTLVMTSLLGLEISMVALERGDNRSEI